MGLDTRIVAPRIDSRAIADAARAHAPTSVLEPLRRLEEAEYASFSAEFSRHVSGGELVERAPPLLVRMKDGSEGILALGCIRSGSHLSDKVTVLAIKEGNWCISNARDEEQYVALTNAYEDGFQLLERRNAAEQRERSLNPLVRDATTVIREIAVSLQELAKDTKLTPDKLARITLPFCAALGASINWNIDHPEHRLLESLRELFMLETMFSIDSPGGAQKLQKSCRDVLTMIREPEGISFRAEHRCREHVIESFALRVLETLRCALFRVDGAIRFNVDRVAVRRDICALSKDPAFHSLIDILGEDDRKIIPGLSTRSFETLLHTFIDALNRSDLKPLDSLRQILLEPLLIVSPSSHQATRNVHSQLAIQLFTGNTVPLRLFDRFAVLNAKTANPIPQKAPFMGTEHIWSGSDLRALYHQHHGALFTVTRAEEREPHFFYLLLPSETPFGVEKKEILATRGINAPVVEHYAYLIVGDHDFSKQVAAQGVDLYHAVTSAVQGFAHLRGADHLLARFRIGNLAVKAHKRVGWEVVTEYKDPHSAFSYGIMRYSTWPAALVG